MTQEGDDPSPEQPMSRHTAAHVADPWRERPKDLEEPPLLVISLTKTPLESTDDTSVGGDPKVSLKWPRKPDSLREDGVATKKQKHTEKHLKAP